MVVRLCGIFIVFLILPGLKPAVAQDSNLNAGGTIGLSATFGTKVKRIGFLFGAYLAFDHVQFNPYFNRFYCFNCLGPDLKKIENQLNIGVTGAFGPPMITSVAEPLFFNPVSNFTGKRHSISYVYKIYSDNIMTSQETGIIGFQTGNILFHAENDLFIFKGSDKYRTGAFSLIYQHQKKQVGLTLLLWTGNNGDKNTLRKRPGEDGYLSKYGYYDLSETEYGQHSHGILAIHAAYALPYFQTLSAKAGIDAEQVRHFVQNKVLHDLPFIPGNFNKSINPHFPMLDTEGKPFINKDYQKIRKPVFFGEMSLNPTLFY